MLIGLARGGRTRSARTISCTADLNFSGRGGFRRWIVVARRYSKLFRVVSYHPRPSVSPGEEEEWARTRYTVVFSYTAVGADKSSIVKSLQNLYGSVKDGKLECRWNFRDLRDFRRIST